MSDTYFLIFVILYGVFSLFNAFSLSRRIRSLEDKCKYYDSIFEQVVKHYEFNSNELK